MYTAQQSNLQIQFSITQWNETVSFLGGFVDQRLVDVRDHSTTGDGSFYKGV
ncbi:hypothetical protein OIU84_000256 [Salix udensis]|uniref:Uncharacterized protein n=1 Tax=Salix udensis TaxID=889485 RepID=A0AAD6L480_9ROSI|nr:hypothetical protein OIU84_000256 [Salix udensis]